MLSCDHNIAIMHFSEINFTKIVERKEKKNENNADLLRKKKINDLIYYYICNANRNFFIH